MKTLTHIIAFIAVICTVSIVSAQSKKEDQNFSEVLNDVFNAKVSLDIDSTLFDTHQGNFHINSASNAMIMTMVAPQGFQKAEADFEKADKEKENYKLLEKKKFVHNGKNVLFQKGSLEEDGKKVIMYMYAIETTAEKTMMITGMHMEGDEKKFFPAIERAALSAKLEPKK